MGNVLQLRNDISGAIGKIIWTARKNQLGTATANSWQAARFISAQCNGLNNVQNVRCLHGVIDAWAQEVDAKMRRYKLG